MNAATFETASLRILRILKMGLLGFGKEFLFYLLFVGACTFLIILLRNNGLHHAILRAFAAGIVTILSSAFVVGLCEFLSLLKYEKAFKDIGLKNSSGQFPDVITLEVQSDGSESLIVKSSGIGIERYKEKKNDLESALGLNIDEIEQGSNPSITKIQLHGKALPKLISYDSLQNHLNAPHLFLVGQSKRNVLTQDITSLPHMLIAGTTGKGKSIFFKQALIGLLKSSPQIQLYLIDLKGGVEMNPFKVLPNARVYKSAESALVALRLINGEMDRRLDILANKQNSKVDFARDQWDLILICVDEASELYGKSTNKEEQKLINQARELTDRIAKLARATGIHLILATQKVLKDTIDTKVQENLEGRMVFKLNTLQGSMTALGNDMACRLPDIAGRGIWKSGNTYTEVQAPYISESDFKKILQDIKEDFEDGTRRNYHSMLESFTRSSDSGAAPLNRDDVINQ